MDLGIWRLEGEKLEPYAPVESHPSTNEGWGIRSYFECSQASPAFLQFSTFSGEPAFAHGSSGLCGRRWCPPSRECSCLPVAFAPPLRSVTFGGGGSFLFNTFWIFSLGDSSRGVPSFWLN